MTAISPRHTQHGAFVVLTALFIFSVLAVLALGVGSAMMAASHVQQHNDAQYTAETALRAFRASGGDMNSVRASVNDLTGLNRYALQWHTNDGLRAADADLSFTSLGNFRLSTPAGGEMQFGRCGYRRVGVTSDVDRSLGLFCHAVTDTADRAAVNAVRVRLKTGSRSLLRLPAFSYFLGGRDLASSSGDAIAFFNPAPQNDVNPYQLIEQGRVSHWVNAAPGGEGADEVCTQFERAGTLYTKCSIGCSSGSCELLEELSDAEVRDQQCAEACAYTTANGLPPPPYCVVC